MPRYLAALTIVLLVGMVLVRALLMKRQGIRAILFGKIDRKDFLIPPFAFFYFYLVFARALRLPLPSGQEFVRSNVTAWPGIGLCGAGLLLFLAGLLSFGRSFRVGIDAEHPDQLIASGVFAYTRNPMYVAFGFVLVGQFLIFSNWTLLAYTIAGFWLFHRQVLREEDFLRKHYGEAFAEYCQRVRRYL